MTPVCPNCQAEIPAEGVNMAEGVAHCAKCNQMFTLGTLGAGAAGPAAAAKPADCDIQHVRDADTLGFILPPAGMKRGGTILAFAIVWNCVVFMFLGIIAYKGEWQALPFLSLFVIIGVGFALAALYMLFGTTSLLMDRETVRLERKLFGKAHTKSRPLAEFIGVDRRSAYQENRQDVWGVHLNFQKPGAGKSSGAFIRGASAGIFSGGMTFATKRTLDEHAWIMGEIRQFLHSVGHPAWKADAHD